MRSWRFWAALLAACCASAWCPGGAGASRQARVDADIVIGVLFPIHRQPSVQVAFTRKCGEIWEQYGMHRVEVLLRTIDRINADHRLLPNISLGYDIRDSCWYSPVALERSIDFIKDSIASLERRSAAAAAAAGNASTSRTAAACVTRHHTPIAGLIGPGSSTVTNQIQNLLRIFHIPQIGYSATSSTLSDSRYFLRVVPSDRLQARALADLVHANGWTYISTVYTDGVYGLRGMEEFVELIEAEGVCRAAFSKVDNNGPDSAYDDVIGQLMTKSTARVVVCFCEGMTIRKLLLATERRRVAGKFLFIGSDGWADRPDVVENIGHLAAGGISIKLYSPPIVDFDDYYFSLRPETNRARNPWFGEFWQQKFDCWLEGEDRQEGHPRACTGNEDLSTDYVQDAKLGFVINAIYTMAYALHDMHGDMCGGRPGLCDAMRPVNGTVFVDYLLNASFVSYSNDRIEFNAHGDPPGRYDIMNYQKRVDEAGNATYEYVRVGGWFNGNLTIDSERVYWPDDGQSDTATSAVRSICSNPCPRGQVKEKQEASKCCWTCKPCKQHEFMLDSASCEPCPQGWWPNERLTACVVIPIEHIEWGDRQAVVAMGFACAGLLATLCVAAVFARHHNTTVVKASTRELSYIILIGIATSYATTFPLVAKPSLLTCYLARVLPGLSFSLIYGALVTKTNRIARILSGSKKRITTRKPRFMSASAQVVITCVIIGVECAIVTAMLIAEPADSLLVYPRKDRVRLTCNQTTVGILVPLGFDILLIVMCTLYAVKTRNLPENFNEAKFIGFTMYTTCVIWVAFVPLYFGSDTKVLTMSLAISLSATVALALLFFRKIYIIVYRPEKNNRSAFTTTKDVRCHIGSAGARSSNDSGDTFQNAAIAIYRQRNLLNRWKHKSGSAPTVGTRGKHAAPSGGAAPPGRPGGGAAPPGRPTRGAAPHRYRCSHDATIVAVTASMGAVAAPPAFCSLLSARHAGPRPTCADRATQTDRWPPGGCRPGAHADGGGDATRPPATIAATTSPAAGAAPGRAHCGPAGVFASEKTALLRCTDAADSTSDESTVGERGYYDPLDDDIDELLSRLGPADEFDAPEASSRGRRPAGEVTAATLGRQPQTHDVVIIHVNDPPGRQTTPGSSSGGTERTHTPPSDATERTVTPGGAHCPGGVDTPPVSALRTADAPDDACNDSSAQPLRDMTSTDDGAISRFREYLKQRGIELDMNVVQSSDV